MAMAVDRQTSRLEYEVESLVKQRTKGQQVRGSLDMLSPELVCGSAAWNWITFQEMRRYRPQPSESKTLTLLMAAMMSLEQTKAEWYAELLPLGDAYKPLALPTVIMSERSFTNYTLGSAWSFEDTRSAPGNVELTMSTKVNEMRTLQYEWRGHSGAIAAYKYSEELITFVNMTDLSGRVGLKQYGSIDPASGMCVINMNLAVIKSCPTCEEQQQVFCTCDSAELEEMFDRIYSERREMLAESFSDYGSGYVGSWLGGVVSMMPLFPCNGKAVTVDHSLRTEGSAFDECLMASLQLVIEQVQPPRISQRFVQMLQEGNERKNEEWSSIINSINDYSESDFMEEFLSGDDIERLSIVRQDQPREWRSTSSKSKGAGRTEGSGRKVNLPCEICGKMFSHRGHLNVHIKLTHEDDRQYSCNICEKKFGLKSRLTRHVQNVHENIRRFKCDICGKMFRDAHFRNKHVLKQH